MKYEIARQKLHGILWNQNMDVAILNFLTSAILTQFE